jgi:hypothetical protein
MYECTENGVLLTDQVYNLQVTCTVTAFPFPFDFESTDCSPSGHATWGGQVQVTIHRPDGSGFMNGGLVAWPDSSGEVTTCDDGPPDFTPFEFGCGGGNGTSPHPSLWAGFSATASGCQPCLCNIEDYATGASSMGNSGGISVTSCNNF